MTAIKLILLTATLIATICLTSGRPQMNPMSELMMGAELIMDGEMKMLGGGMGGMGQGMYGQGMGGQGMGGYGRPYGGGFNQGFGFGRK